MQQQKKLIKEVTDDEIMVDIKMMPRDKAPGMDGFPIELFTSNWELVKSDILVTVL